MTDSSEHPHVIYIRSLLAKKSTPKAKGERMGRDKAVNRVNAPRLEQRRAEAFGPCSRMARRSGCAVRGCKHTDSKGLVDPAHVRSRGAGGGDWANVVGLCSTAGTREGHHQEQHRIGIESFCERYRLSLDDVAMQIAEKVSAHLCEEFPERSRRGVRCAICLNPVDEKGLEP